MSGTTDLVEVQNKRGKQDFAFIYLPYTFNIPHTKRVFFNVRDSRPNCTHNSAQKLR
jgi:hypothetical protein